MEAPSPGPALVIKKLSFPSSASFEHAGCNATAQSAIDAQTSGFFFIIRFSQTSKAATTAPAFYQAPFSMSLDFHLGC